MAAKASPVAVTTIAQVRALHLPVYVSVPVGPTPFDPVRTERHCDDDGQLWPCRTIRAVEAAESSSDAFAVILTLHRYAKRFLRGYWCVECRAPWPCHTADVLLLPGPYHI